MSRLNNCPADDGVRAGSALEASKGTREDDPADTTAAGRPGDGVTNSTNAANSLAARLHPVTVLDARFRDLLGCIGHYTELDAAVVSVRVPNPSSSHS